MKTELSLLLSKKSVQVAIAKKRALANEFQESPLSRSAFASEKGISRDTLAKILSAAEAGTEALIDSRHFNPGRPQSVQRHHLQWALGYMAANPKVPVSVLTEQLNLVAKREGWAEINYFTLRRAIHALPTDQIAILRNEGEGFFQKHFPIGQRIVGVPLQMVQIDSTECDVWCVDMATGEVFRPWLTAVIDCCTRVVLAIHVHRLTPNAKDLLRLLKEAILPKKNRNRPWFGIWQAANTDNALIFNDGAVTGAMLQLGVNWGHSPIRCSSANGKIERLIGIVATRLFKRLPGYSNNEGAKGRVKAKGGIPWPLMQGIVDRFIDTDYSLRKHDGLNMSPWEAWHEKLDSVKNLIFDVQETNEAFRYPETAEVQRGAFLLANMAYKAPELATVTGKNVTVWVDPDSFKKRLDVTFDGKFLCEAVRDDGDLADILNAERTARTIELRRQRKDAPTVLTTIPPEEAIPIRKPKRLRKSKVTVLHQIAPAPPLAVEE